MSDFSTYKKLETARIGSSGDIVTPSQPISQSHQRVDRFSIANASANAAEAPFVTVPYASHLVSARLVFGSASNGLANASQYAVATLSKRTAGGAAVTVATANTANANIAAFNPFPLTLVANAANTSFAAGDELTVTVTNTPNAGNGAPGNAVASLDVLWEDDA